MLRITSFLVVFLAILSAHGFAQDQEGCCCGESLRPTVDVKAGYFFFSNSKMRKVYNQGGLDVRVAGLILCGDVFSCMAV